MFVDVSLFREKTFAFQQMAGHLASIMWVY